MSNKFHKYTSKDIENFIKKAKKCILIDHISVFINSSKNAILNNLNSQNNNTDESNDEKILFNSSFFADHVIAIFVITHFLIIIDGSENRFNEVTLTPQMYKILKNSIQYLETLEYRVIKSKLTLLETKYREPDMYKIKETEFFDQTYIIFENNKNFSDSILKGSMIIQNRPHNTIIIDFIINLLMFLVLYTLNYNSISPYWQLFVQNTQMVGVWSNSSWLNRIDLFMKPRITTSFLSSFFNSYGSEDMFLKKDFIDSVTKKIILYQLPIPENFASSLLENISNKLTQSIHLFEFNIDLNNTLCRKMSQKVFEEAITLTSNICNSFGKLSSLITLSIYNPKNKFIDKNSIIINFSKIVYGLSVSNQSFTNHHIINDANQIINENTDTEYDNDLIYNYDYQSNRYNSDTYKKLLDESSSGESSSHGSSYYSEDDSEVASQSSFDQSVQSEESGIDGSQSKPNDSCTTVSET